MNPGFGISVGIDLGTRNVRVASVSGGNAKRISQRSREEGQDMVSLFTALREDAEIFLKNFVSSCVVALNNSISDIQGEALIRAANAAGFEDARLMESPVAAALAFGRGKRLLVLDFGAAAKLSVVEEGKNGVWRLRERIAEPGSASFDLALAGWLWERLSLPGVKTEGPRWRALLQEAERIKIALSNGDVFRWTPPEAFRTLPELAIEREDMERLTRFSIRSLIHTARRLWSRYGPERLLLVGGASRTPLLLEVLRQEMEHPELLIVGQEDAVALGAALHAFRGKDVEDGEFLEIKRVLDKLEPLLTRAQQNKLRLLLNQAEAQAGVGPSAPRMLETLRGLARDLKRAVG